MKYLDYLQIPYKHQGFSSEGADCFGLLYLFYKQEMGIALALPDFDYAEDWWKEKNYILELYKQYSFKRVTDAPQFGDVLLFKNNNERPGHIGIVLDDGNFIHMTLTGTGITTFAYGVWNRQIHSRYRYVKRRRKC